MKMRCLFILVLTQVFAQQEWQATVTPEGEMTIYGAISGESIFSFVVCELPVQNENIFDVNCIPTLDGNNLVDVFDLYDNTPGTIAAQIIVGAGETVTDWISNYGTFRPERSNYFFYEFSSDVAFFQFGHGMTRIVPTMASTEAPVIPPTDPPTQPPTAPLEDCMCAGRMGEGYFIQLTTTRYQSFGLQEGARGEIMCGVQFGQVADILLVQFANFGGGSDGPNRCFCGTNLDVEKDRTMYFVECHEVTFVENCGAPEILNANIDGCETTALQENCDISCIKGYELSTEVSYISCSEQGRWGDLPTCNRANCEIPVIDNSNAIDECSDVQSLESCDMTCENGFELEGTGGTAATLNCDENGSWESLVSCVPIGCTTPDIPNSNAATCGTAVGDVCNIICNAGSQIFGASEITCEFGGQWSPRPDCIAAECIPLQILNSNSLVICDGLTAGNSCDYSCNEGYRFVEENGGTATCNEQGNWENAITCERIPCDPLDVANSDADECSLAVGTTCWITCDHGYERNGPLSVKCNAGPEWSAEPPSCDPIPCGALNIANSNADVCGDLQVDDECVVTCEFGYELIGESNEVTCLIGPSFFPPDVGCVEIPCGVVDIANSNSLSCGSLFPDDICEIECDSGYELNDDSLEEIECFLGAELSELPSCDMIPCDAPEIENANLEGFTDVPVGDSYTVVCDDFYHTEGEATIHCEFGPQWTSELPQCIQVTCGALDIPNSNSASCDRFVGDTCEIICDEGYEIDGESSLTCQQNLDWSGDAPECEPIPCDVPNIDNSNSAASTCEQKLSVGDTCEIVCDDGYEIRNSINSITCQFGPEITSTPECELIPCSSPVIQNSNPNECDNTEVGDECEISCDDDFHIDGHPTIMCEVGPTWSHVPSCKEGSAALSPKTCLQLNLRSVDNLCLCADSFCNLDDDDGVSFSRAKRTCEDQNMRLCTIDEIDDDLTRQTGCSYDFKSLWSSTPCENGGYYTGPGEKKNGERDGIVVECTPQDETNVYTRCCADQYPESTCTDEFLED